MIYRLRIGDYFTGITKEMSNLDQFQLNMDLKDEWRVENMLWWESQREAVFKKNAPARRRGAEIDAFAHYDTTNKPVLHQWESHHHIKSFRVHMSADGDKVDFKIDVHAMSPTDASARAASINRRNGNKTHHPTRTEKIKRQPFPEATVGIEAMVGIATQSMLGFGDQVD